MTTEDQPDFGIWRIWTGILAVIVLGLVAGGCLFYRVEAQHIRLDKYNELAAIGEMKAGEIARWRQERLNNAVNTAESPFFRKGIEAWLKDSGNVVLRDEFLQRLKLEQKTEDVADALLLDVDGRVLLTAKDDPEPVDAATMKAVALALEGKQASLSDLFRSPGGDVHIDAVAPVPDANNRPIAVVVLRSNATEFLYPLIQSWPIPSQSDETLLVQKEGDDILFLNELRHQAGAALSFRIPLTRGDNPAVQAAHGKQGMFEGKDYRGVDVLADLRPVPGSPWFMVAKVDRSEILAEVRYRAGVIAVFVVLFILLAAAVVAFFYRQQQVRLYRAQVETEGALRYSEEKWRSLTEFSPDYVMLLDRKARVIFINHTMPGLTREQVIGTSFYGYAPKEYEQPARECFERVLQTGQPDKFESIYRYADGTLQYFESYVGPVRRNDDIVGLTVSSRNVTERKKAEEALRESAERFRLAINATQEGIWEWDIQTHQEFFSPRWCEIIGYSLDDPELPHTYDSWTSRIHPDDSERVMSALKNHLEKGTKYDVDYRHRHKSGEYRWQHSIGQAVFDESGKPTKMVGCISDITERKKAEKTLQDIIDKNPMSIQIIDKDGFTLNVNSAHTKLFGAIPPPDYSVFNDPQLKQHGYGELIERIKNGEVVTFPDMPYNAHDSISDLPDVPVWVYVAAFPINDSNGKPERFILVHVDITERKRAEEALRVSLEKYRVLFESSPLGITVSDKSGKIIEANRQSEHLLGITREAHAQRRIDGEEWQIIRKDGTPMPVDEYASTRALRENRLIENVEMGLVKDKGEITWISVTAAPIPLEGYGVAIAYGDITERKRAEKALRDNEQRLLSIYNTVGDVIFHLEVETEGQYRFVSVNPSFCRVTGLSQEQIVGKPVTEVIPEPSLTMVLGKYRQAIESKTIVRWEEVSDYPTGRLIGAVSVTPVFDDKGKCTHLVGSVHDMTERKKAEEERKRTERKYHNLYSAMNEGCTICEVIFDGAGKAVDFVIRDVNAAYEANTGLARNEVVGRRASELFGKHPFMDIYEKVAVTGKPTSFEGFFPQLKRHLRISAFALERGVFSTIVRDITEEKEAEEEIQAYQGKLKSLASQLTLAEEREKRRIAGELHDQVSQSLAFSKMKLEVLRKSNVPAEAAKTLREVSELIGEVIRDTKSLTFDLSSPMLYERGFEAAVTEWLSEQVERRHGIATEFEDDGQSKPLDNEVQVILFRDVRELLTNAVKHAHASKVKVSVRRKDEHIEVCVEDNGVGFEPAETSAGSAARSEFGLFSIRERLEQLGGHLEIDSAPGRGCRATVVAPLKVQKKRNPKESEQ